MSIGHGTGDDRVVDAVTEAVTSPLLEVSIDGAKGVLLNVIGSEDLGLLEVYDAAEIVARSVDPEAQIMFGAVVDPHFPPGQVRVTLIATGLDASRRTRRSARATSSAPRHARRVCRVLWPPHPSRPRARRPPKVSRRPRR